MNAAAIIALIEAAIAIVREAPKVIAVLKQNKELSVVEEAELDKKIQALSHAPHWRP